MLKNDPIVWYNEIVKKCGPFRHIVGIDSFLKHAACYSTVKDISNWQGIEGEMHAVQNACHVTGVNQTVRCDDYATKAQIDLIAGNGLAWVEVKTCTNTSNFLSNAGFDRQARKLQQAANSECNKIQFVSPRVVYYFPMGKLDPELADFLHQLGFMTATDTASLQAATDMSLPPHFKYNLDISAMLNLSTELALPNGIVQTIFNEPETRFIAFEGAVQRVDTMLNDFGSTIELKNWKRVLETLDIFDKDAFVPTRKITVLDAKMNLSPIQRDIYGLGDAMQAITITSCGGLMRRAQSHNCPIHHILHQPIPLSGEVSYEQF